ncbi:MAG: RNA polymerase sigma factor [Acidobacteriota bacterium]|nr:RNA polymerase sigma factor [Acidobacteriota bacterium]
MACAAVADLDTQLMLRVKEEDTASFELLLNRHRSVVVNYLARLVHNYGIAEELAQDVFIRVYRSRQAYEPSAKFTTWLFRITTNVALNHFRDEQHDKLNVSLDQESPNSAKRDAPDRRATAEQILVREDCAREVRQAVQSLPEKQRAAVLMHKYEEMDYAQISRVLGCSQSALKALMFRAYETLREKLAHMAPV